jgi:RNA polymerase sigma-70 factor, ECF subfamily
VNDISPAQPSDEQLVLAIGQGEASALRVLLERYQNPLRRLARHMLQDPAGADDAVQDAFIRVFRAAGKFKPTGSAAGWLYRITMNACRDRLRKRKRRAISLEQLAHEPAAAEGPKEMEVAETVQQVRHAVDQLPDRQRTAVLLHRYQGMTHSQIAEATGWSTSAVESLLVRAYGNLRKTLSHLTHP